MQLHVQCINDDGCLHQAKSTIRTDVGINSLGKPKMSRITTTQILHVLFISAFKQHKYRTLKLLVENLEYSSFSSATQLTSLFH